MRTKCIGKIIIDISHMKRRKDFVKIIDQTQNIEEIRIKVEEAQKEWDKQKTKEQAIREV